MATSSIGNLSQVFLSQRHNLDLRTRLNSLSSEFASGRKDDVARSLGGETKRLTSVERRVSLLDTYMLASSEAAQELEVAQQALARVDSVRSGLSENLLNADIIESDLYRERMSNSAKEAFTEIVSALNVRFADRFIFAGAASGGPALASSEDMIISIEAAVSGLSTLSDVEDAIDTWFNDPAGGFATLGYIGDSGDTVVRRIDERQSISMEGRADVQAIKDVLKATALGFSVAASSVSAYDHSQALRNAGVGLVGAAESLITLRSEMGGAQLRIEEIRSMQIAEQTTLSRIYNDLVQTDQFETGLALQEIQTQLETHYTVTARLSRLSLVEYL